MHRVREGEVMTRLTRVIRTLRRDLKWWRDNARSWKRYWDEAIRQRDNAIASAEMLEKELTRLLLIEDAVRTFVKNPRLIEMLMKRLGYQEE